MKHLPLPLCVFAACMLVGLTAHAQDADVPDQDLILDFESSEEVDGLRGHAENLELDIVQDYCVTRNANCLRVVGMMEQPYASLVVTDPAALENAEHYDYVAMDAYNNSERAVKLTLELWDAKSVDYYSRSTMDGDPAEARTVMLRPGMNHLYWPIQRPRRNAKEGMDWRDIKDGDLVDRANLTQLKIFFQPEKSGGDTVFWMDNLRFVKAHMVGGLLEPPALPEGSVAYKFGNAFYCPEGWTSIALQDALPGRPRRAPNVIGTGVAETGAQWPDSLTGNGLYCPQGNFSFSAEVPDGTYRVWLSAGRVLHQNTLNLPFQLRIGDETLLDEESSQRTYYSEKGIFRYLDTQYSQRPRALWLDYALPEAETYTTTVTVRGGRLRVRLSNLMLAAMVLVPEAQGAAFDTWTNDVREARAKAFYDKTWTNIPEPPERPEGAGAYTLWEPPVHEATRPWSAPPADQAAQTTFAWSGARGQRLSQRVCVTPWEDLGMGELSISDFTGPARIPASAVRLYYMNYRFQTGSGSVSEMTLLLRTRIRFEPRLTWAYWLWMQIPEDAPAGTYEATVTFTPDHGGTRTVPVTLTVHPFALEDKLPVSYGMYYNTWNFRPSRELLPEEFANADQFVLHLTREQFRFMREIGFTSTRLPAPFVHQYHMRADGISPYWNAAREAGLGRHPKQLLMTYSLHMARRVGRDIFYEADPDRYGMEWLDRNPGDEFRMPSFRARLMPVLRDYKAWVDKMGLPVAMEVIDEPREVPNPWNRRRDETIRYAEWLKEAGFEHTFVSFMGDVNNGLDYTPIVDYIDIVAVHATPHSERLIQEARAQDKTLWFYNVGMDRFSWGFYNWAMNSEGRWEWHFCFSTPGGVKGFRNTAQWYTPFTSLDGYAMHAPYFTYTGGMTFKSVFFTVQEGITDYAYLTTLERELDAARARGRADAAAVKDAREFLAAVRSSIPEFPRVRNMVGAGSGALVGTGLDTPVAEMTDHWRQHIAALITRLQAVN